MIGVRDGPRDEQGGFRKLGSGQTAASGLGSEAASPLEATRDTKVRSVKKLSANIVGARIAALLRRHDEGGSRIADQRCGKTVLRGTWDNDS